MKTLKKTLLLASLAVSFGAFVSAPVGAQDAKPQSDSQKFSYSLGARIGSQIKAQSDRDGIEIDSAILLDAMKSALTGKALSMTAPEMQAAMQAQQEMLKAKQVAAAKTNVEAGNKFREAYEKEKGVTKTASGLLYKVVTAGKGEKPTAANTVVVNYEGALIDGKVFDSSYKRGQPATFGVGRVIPGWQEVLQLMPAGSTYEVVIPPNLAYGEQGSPGGIPPNSTLKFKVELIEVKKPEAPKAPAAPAAPKK